MDNIPYVITVSNELGKMRNEAVVAFSNEPSQNFTGKTNKYQDNLSYSVPVLRSDLVTTKIEVQAITAEPRYSCCSAEVNNAWSCTSSLSYTLMTLCLIYHTDFFFPSRSEVCRSHPH